MGFARTKETGNPDAVRTFIVVIGFQEGIEPLRDFIRQDVFFDFDAKAGVVVSLDNSFYGTVNRLAEQVIELHGGSFLMVRSGRC